MLWILVSLYLHYDKEKYWGSSSVFWARKSVDTDSKTVYSETSNNGHLCTTATSWFTVGKESPCRIQGQTLIKNLPTAVTSNRRPNGHFLLSQCLILHLLTVTKATLCKRNKGKMKKDCFIYLENIYFLKIIYFWTYCRGH